jgi:hypothetical protein
MPYKEKQKRLAYSKKYYFLNKGKWPKQPYNKEKNLTYHKRYVNRHKERVRAYDRNFKNKYYEKYKQAVLERNRKRKYGITRDQYNQKFKKQKGCCAICGMHQSQLKKALGVDHNHKTKKLRGLLCHYCNAGIGCLRDSIVILKKAIAYLRVKEELNG